MGILRWRALIVALVCAAIGTARAAEVPTSGERDARMRYVKYVRDQVTVVTVRRGSVTRIMLEGGEKIAVAATGFAADCAKNELEWCVRADVGTNQIWVKPKDNATFNNLELHTDRRDYSFEFKVLADAPHGRTGKASAKALQAQPMFRVMFEYPIAAPVSSMLATAGSSGPNLEKVVINDRLKQGPMIKNTNYTMQVLEAGADVAPALVFDDGRHTYFQFPGNREIPSIFYRSRDGEEGRVNFHMEGDVVVVERTSRQFVLRLGKAVVGIWNEQYDPDGEAPVGGTTNPNVTRTVRQP